MDFNQFKDILEYWRTSKIKVLFYLVTAIAAFILSSYARSFFSKRGEIDAQRYSKVNRDELLDTIFIKYEIPGEKERKKTQPIKVDRKKNTNLGQNDNQDSEIHDLKKNNKILSGYISGDFVSSKFKEYLVNLDIDSGIIAKPNELGQFEIVINENVYVPNKKVGIQIYQNEKLIYDERIQLGTIGDHPFYLKNSIER